MKITGTISNMVLILTNVTPNLILNNIREILAGWTLHNANAGGTVTFKSYYN